MVIEYIILAGLFLFSFSEKIMEIIGISEDISLIEFILLIILIWVWVWALISLGLILIFRTMRFIFNLDRNFKVKKLWAK